MTRTAQSRTFEEATAITASGPGAYVADVDPLWTVVGNPNGGYLQAIMARAAVAASSHPHVVAASTHFLSVPRPGRVSLDVETLRQGRSITQVRVRLSQDATPRAESVFSLGSLSEAGQARWASDGLPAAGAPFEDCPRFLPPREGFAVELLHQVHLHLEPESPSSVHGAPRGIGELRGWLDLPGGEAFDPASLLFAADALPPATFDIAFTGWVPTVELSTYVRSLPAPGPVHVVFEANLVQDGRVDETCTVRDGRGTIVAQSHQLAGIRMD